MIVELEIGGMTCASCASRIERKLNRMDGVTASVNYATEKATATVADGVTAADLIATVHKTGYTATLPAAEPEETEKSDPLRDRLIISGLLSVPVIVLAMVPAWQFDYWQWLSLTLAAPVVVYGGWPFHRATWTNLRHGAATMDTLVSLGTGVRGEVAGKDVLAGRAALLEQHGWTVHRRGDRRGVAGREGGRDRGSAAVRQGGGDGRRRGERRGRPGPGRPGGWPWAPARTWRSRRRT
ncbi:hypothetical protein Asi03nite_41230 [Actinoplanes siamensis]|uniref:HMA domain-containing protein n=1 Tax=Actinoplanes siamensis TaxID=1223317 RepID=A0A919N976_9ACTN|nr:hypothetical protein Asi03nite_41230 [Actinoplanes siamensis]